MYKRQIENLVVVKALGNKYELETLTLAPIDRQLIEINLLSKSDINWLNTYHKKVYKKLEKYLEPKEKAWLKKECSDL